MILSSNHTLYNHLKILLSNFPMSHVLIVLPKKKKKEKVMERLYNITVCGINVIEKVQLLRSQMVKEK